MRRRNSVYACRRWRSIRDAYLLAHPVCEICDATGRTAAASDVHHIVSPFVDGEAYAYDELNLIALCKDCHGGIHGRHDELRWRPVYGTSGDERREVIRRLINDNK